ncbi:MFS transporter [Lactobacillus sp. ESL0731]|uniref:MFS transporter n=1 Tax=unclassified Lactobacillus TaxID=2620435 RepID=UPI0023F70435|nr:MULTISPECIES: MFS transporter [unclassified Lactobacillus]WEV51013.1 MFS transporter [Lactobacillus sp. ESL0700]WEV62144.1 MFS transporter [Lactobacillus sp. ESL0731]
MDIFLKNKNYRKFTIASWLSSAGNILFYLALMTYASKLKNYALALSLISITEAVPDLLQSIGGYFADRTKNKFQVIIRLAIIRFILYMIVGALFVTNIAGWNLVLLVIAINFISDVSGMYSSGLQTPLIVGLVGEKEVSVAEGFTGGISQLISMGAQFVGSALLLFMSYSSLAILNALTFLVAGLIYANIAKNIAKTPAKDELQTVNDQNFLATFKSSFNQAKQAHGLLTIVIVVALLNGILSALEPLISISFAANKNMLIGTFSFTIAIFGAVVSIGTALGSAIGTKLLKDTSLFIIILLDTISGILMLGSMLMQNSIACFIFGAILGFFAGTASPKLYQWLVQSVDRKILASTMGALSTILVIAGPLTNAIFSSIAGTAGLNYALIGLIALSAVTFLITLIVMFKTRNNKQVEVTAE